MTLNDAITAINQLTPHGAVVVVGGLASVSYMFATMAKYMSSMDFSMLIFVLAAFIILW